MNGSVNWEFVIHDYFAYPASPTVADGKVFLSNSSGGFPVIAVDAATGVKAWTYEGGIGISNPAVVNGLVYASDELHKLLVPDAATGTEKWKY